MKKQLGIVVLALLLVVSMSYGQSAYKMGDRVLSAGIGLGALAGGYGDNTLPALSIGLDYGYNENISFGGIVGIAGSEFRYSGGYGWDYTYIIIGGRGAYHFLDLFKDSKIDSYAGLTVGYNIVSWKEVGTPVGVTYSASGSYLIYGLHAGLRYYFNDKLAVQGEIGYGLGLLNLGIAYKL